MLLHKQGSHGHGKSWKKLLSWKSHGIASSHGCGSFHVVRHNHNHIQNHVRMGVMEFCFLIFVGTLTRHVASYDTSSLQVIHTITV